MLDNLRDQATFKEEEEPLESTPIQQTGQPKPPRSFDRMTGLTAPQRFILAVMLAIVICLLGTLFLVFSGKIVPSFSF